MNECDRRSGQRERNAISLKFTCESASCSVPKSRCRFRPFPASFVDSIMKISLITPLGFVRSLCEELSPAVYGLGLKSQFPSPPSGWSPTDRSASIPWQTFQKSRTLFNAHNPMTV